MSSYLLVLADGDPAEPSVFVTSDPPGRWKAGDVAFVRPGVQFVILDVQHVPEGGNSPPRAGEHQALWTVEPI